MEVTARAAFLTRRTYNRPLDEEGLVYETWEQTIDRVIGHQRWLWERAAARPLTEPEEAELMELRQLMLQRKVLTSGRTLWLGGTDVAKRREASQFNCAFTFVETVYDVVDVLWLLLQGCGVGFHPVPGTLSGFRNPIPNIEVIRSTRTEKGGDEFNRETWDPDTKTWTIRIGDSAEAWARSIGKLLAGKYPAQTLVLDFSQIRPAGERLKGYGWISSGDYSIAAAYTAIADILSKRADSLLTRIDLLDIVNHLGTVLSSRRSAEICLFEFGGPEWEEFALAKRVAYEDGYKHRQQSNNSLLFNSKPTRKTLEYIFQLMQEAGGSEPGFINAAAARMRAPWFKGVNPCAEILLGNKSFCNLTETDIGKFKGDTVGLLRAITLAARANYRQTCVNLRDGVLQESWHLNNDFLRLCGVGLTGIVRRPDLTGYDYRVLERAATSAAYGMADELGLPRPKNVTTVKPSGTLGKIMDTTEGVHRPMAKYIFNNVIFSKYDPLVPALRSANYRVVTHPNDPESVLITLPVSYPDVKMDHINGREIDQEPAVEQLERYKMLMDNWCHQNVSATIYYWPNEVPEIIDWLDKNWGSYVGVSFMPRFDVTATAKDLGYNFLPQEVVTKEVFEAYEKQLLPVNLEVATGIHEIEHEACAGGACPIR